MSDPQGRQAIILQDLLQDLQSHSYDPASTTNEQYAAKYNTDLLAAHKEMVKRNTKLTDLLDHYIQNYDKKSEENMKYKEMLFSVFVGLFILFTFGVFIVFIKTDLNDVTAPLAVSLVSVGATYVGSIFVVYELMFKYLFPIDEEKDMINMIKTVIDNDLKLEEHIAKISGFQKPPNKEWAMEPLETKPKGKKPKRSKRDITFRKAQ